MSLDVYLRIPGVRILHDEAIYIRENGDTVAITREEWDKRFPGHAPVVLRESEDYCIYQARITHNLGRMADVADLYVPLWHPESLAITRADDLIPYLEKGLAKLRDPSRMAEYLAESPANGWGNYDALVQFVERYLEACKRFPSAEIETST